MEELAYARDSFGILGLRALFSVRFHACAAMLVGVLGVVGWSSFWVWDWEDMNGSELRNECVGVAADAEKDVCSVFLVVVTKDVRFASRLDFRGECVGLLVFEGMLVEDVMLEIDRRRIEVG